VHVLRVDADAEELAEASDELSFLGHQDAVTGLAFSDDGTLVASAGLDHAIRIWDTGTGLPRPFHVRISASVVGRMAFSPSGSRLAALAGHRLWVIDTGDGAALAEVELGELHAGVVFAAEDQIYMGGESGALRNLASDISGGWHLRNVWQGQLPIRNLGISPNRRQLLIVDAQHVAQVLNIGDGRIGTATLSLPEAVTDILFSPAESRVLLRTARWIHRAGVSPAGLIWLDAIRSPKALAGSQMVFDNHVQGGGQSGSADDPLGDRVMLLTRDAGFPEVAELSFSFSAGPSLYGNKDGLLAEWRPKLGVGQVR
jgi:hypothetical protein